MEAYRRAASEAVHAFSSDRRLPTIILMGEHQPAMPVHPIDACRQMVRHADVVIGIYGSRYGFVDERTGKSATHLEAEWTLGEFFRPLLAFIVDQGDPDIEQRRLLAFIESFRLGVYVSRISSPEELRLAVYRALETNLAHERAEASALAAQHQFVVHDLHHLAVPLRCANSLVDLKAPTEGGHPFLSKTVEQALESGTQLVFVLGEVGCGKTWFLKQLFLAALERHQRNRHKPRPVYVDLGQTLQPDSNPSPWRWDELLGPRTDAPLLLLLDAYDEAVAKSPPGSRLRLLQSIVGLVPHNKVIISSRSHLFETGERLTRLLEAAKYGLRPGSHKASFSHVTLFVRPLSNLDVQRFLREEFQDTEGFLWNRMSSVIDLADLAKRPVLLPMICSSLDSLPDDSSTSGNAGPLTAGGLYRIYVDHWLSRESWRLRLSEDAGREFFQDLALYFHNMAVDSILFDEIAVVFPQYFPSDSWSPERERIGEAVRSATFLSNNEVGQYGFAHRSFLEYFLAERCVRAFRRIELGLDLRRFPSKVTDSFTLDLLRKEGNWQHALLRTAEDAYAPIVRYLAVYLIARLAKDATERSISEIVNELDSLTEREPTPFVTRELLVTLIGLGAALKTEALERHLDNPIDDETIRNELKDYYGSTEEAVRYLRDRLTLGSTEPLRLFYLISLAAICNEIDLPTLSHYEANGTLYEQRIAKSAITSLSQKGNRYAQ
jgi:Domain of unknown function (DUF4062)/NACHT domain